MRWHRPRRVSVARQAAELLGLDAQDAETLFLDGFSNTSADAAQKLRKFADAGEIDVELWTRVEDD